MRPFPTPCVHCGSQRFSGWTLERAKFRIPICSRFLQKIVERQGWFKNNGPVPNLMKVRFKGRIWHVRQETR